MENSFISKIMKSVDLENTEAINDYLDNLQVSNNSKRMYSYHICKYMNEHGLDSTRVRHYEQQFKTVKNDLTYDEVQKCKACIDDLELSFIFNGLLDTGMRIQEFCSVEWENVNEQCIAIKTIKNKNEFRNTFLTDDTFLTLNKLKSIQFNFQLINVKRIQYKLSNLGKRAGLSISLSPHVLRRTKGSLLRMNGAALEDIADVLGHKNMETTRKYYSKLNRQYIKSVSELSTIKPSESLDLQSLQAENKLLKKQIILLQEEIAKLKSKE